MEFVDLPECKKPYDYDFSGSISIAPIDRLRIMDDREFEDMVLEWANDYLENTYYKVSTMQGSGDKGRDIVAYYKEKKYDIYQCKHYDTVIAPSSFWLEFGKLCYYTYKNDYKTPRKYYIVSSKGIGQALRDLIDNPCNINESLIKNWNKHCAKKITKGKNIILENNFLNYVENFDFGIVDEITPITLLEQHSKTIWHKFRFGGGIKKRNKPEVSFDVSKDEEEFNYVKELLEVYSQKVGDNICSTLYLKKYKKLYENFIRYRETFYYAQALKRFSRDEFLDSEPYNSIKREVYGAIIDDFDDEYISYYLKVKSILKTARNLPLKSKELGEIDPSEKVGLCHDMVNEYEISWVNDNG
ncbi:ABC-three component system protein [Metaclostridioides mangenotii]|uniref:ABC-three component system protein n=1 Tax=Metaclostridioides mangenotii TaxID=1540 RepID=UPI0028E1F0E6|nr:ABC-three component system protein [Clostridioides mangenotii]